MQSCDRQVTRCVSHAKPYIWPAAQRKHKKAQKCSTWKHFENTSWCFNWQISQQAKQGVLWVGTNIPRSDSLTRSSTFPILSGLLDWRTSKRVAHLEEGCQTCKSVAIAACIFHDIQWLFFLSLNEESLRDVWRLIIHWFSLTRADSPSASEAAESKGQVDGCIFTDTHPWPPASSRFCCWWSSPLWSLEESSLMFAKRFTKTSAPLGHQPHISRHSSLCQIMVGVPRLCAPDPWFVKPLLQKAENFSVKSLPPMPKSYFITSRLFCRPQQSSSSTPWSSDRIERRLRFWNSCPKYLSTKQHFWIWLELDQGEEEARYSKAASPEYVGMLLCLNAPFQILTQSMWIKSFCQIRFPWISLS